MVLSGSGGGGGAAGGRRRSKGLEGNAKFLSVHLHLIALCPEAHDLIIFSIASASSATNLIEGHKIIQPLQKKKNAAIIIFDSVNTQGYKTSFMDDHIQLKTLT